MTLLIVSCNRKEVKQEQEQSMPVHASQRFEEDLLTDGARQPFALKSKYPGFFNLFFFQVVGIGTPDSALLERRIIDFAKDSDITVIGKEVKALYADFSPFDRKLTSAFSQYKQFFPKRPIPQTLTYISGFNNSIICADSLLGMGLDMYLGENSKYYKALQFPVYRTRRMTKEYIAADAIKGWLQSEWTEDEMNADLLSHMIYEGKIQYVMKQLMPGEADSVRTGYTQQQIDWCRENEKNIWSFFIGKKLLFSTDQNFIMKYVSEGPTTNGFPKESPGNIGQWTGTKIVEAYMENHKDMPLEKLMEENDYKKILLDSQYKP